MATADPNSQVPAIFVEPNLRTAVWHAVAPYIDQVHRQHASENFTLIDVRNVIEAHLHPGATVPVISTDDLLFIAGSILAMLEQRVLLSQRSAA